MWYSRGPLLVLVVSAPVSVPPWNGWNSFCGKLNVQICDAADCFATKVPPTPPLSPSHSRVSIVFRTVLFHHRPYISLHFVVINQRQKRRAMADLHVERSCAIHEIVFGSVRHRQVDWTLTLNVCACLWMDENEMRLVCQWYEVKNSYEKSGLPSNRTQPNRTHGHRPKSKSK